MQHFKKWILFPFQITILTVRHPIRILSTSTLKKKKMDTEKQEKVNIHPRNCISLEKNLHKQFTLCHTRLNHISAMSIYFYTLFLLFACRLLPPPPSLLYHFLFSSLIFSLSFFPISILSSFDVANWRKKYVNNFFFVIIFQTELCKML